MKFFEISYSKALSVHEEGSDTEPIATSGGSIPKRKNVAVRTGGELKFYYSGLRICFAAKIVCELCLLYDVYSAYVGPPRSPKILEVSQNSSMRDSEGTVSDDEDNQVELGERTESDTSVARNLKGRARKPKQKGNVCLNLF